MLRVTFGGDELAGLEPGLPAASVRLLLPSPRADGLVVPRWDGNEFLLPDGQRPVLRTYTPAQLDLDALELDLDIVLHDRGMASAWAELARPGDPAAVSGTGRGYAIDRDAPAFVLAGDETAVPAISQLLGALPEAATVRVLVEAAHPDARLPLPAHPRSSVQWLDLPPGAPPGDALVTAILRAAIDPGTKVWAAGEAAAMQRIRRHLFEERGLARSHAHVRGYWKHGRAGGDSADDT
jgi:NADPH-dependent ferric siderophore reductase